MSESDSESGSYYSSSSEEEIIQKPIFIAKKKKDGDNTANTKSMAREIALQKIDRNLQLQENIVDTYGDFDGINDTDNVDVEQEYRDWQGREKRRLLEYKETLRLREQEKNDRIHVPIETQPLLNAPSQTKNTENKDSKLQLGAFYATDKDINKFFKRDYTQMEDQGDFSRPTRFKR